MFELKNGRMYELRYDFKSVEKLESATGKSTIQLIQTIPPISILKQMMSVALFDENGNRVSVKRGTEVAEELIKEKGVLECFNNIVERIFEDCAFLFQNA